MLGQQTKDSLHQSILNYLVKEIKNNSKNDDFVEGLEVDEELAENLKIQGNHCMKNDQYEEAIKCYTEAIKANPKNSVYLCNRHVDSIVDCWRALDISPDYGKAYGRMGLAYSNLNDHSKAVECYKKALELDPESESIQQNLKVAQDRLAQSGGRPTIPNLAGGLPENMSEVYNIAEQLMSDSNLQNMFYSAVQNAMANPPGTAEPGAPQENSNTPTPEGGTNSVFNLGQQLISDFRQNNPAGFDRIMRTFNNCQPRPAENNAANTNAENNGDNSEPPNS